MCCFRKNVAFNAIEAFQQGQEYNGADVWQQYEKFGIDILFVVLGHQEIHYKYG